MDLLQCFGSSDRPTERHHRVTLGVGSGQARRQIGDTGSRGCDGDASLAGHAADAASNEGRVLLMPADDRLDRRVNKRIEYRVDLGARNAKDMCHALHFQSADDQFGTDLLRLIYDLVHRQSPSELVRHRRVPQRCSC